jgi:hypothetical protein
VTAMRGAALQCSHFLLRGVAHLQCSAGTRVNMLGRQAMARVQRKAIDVM